MFATPDGLSQITTQAGEDAMQERPLSTLLMAASRVSNSVGRLIPSISSVAVPSAWVLAAAGQLASSFGYAKPQTTVAPVRMYSYVGANEQNVNGAVMTSNLGLFMDNAVTAQPGFAGSDVDEMAFEYVLSRMCCIYVGLLSITDPEGLTLVKYSCRLDPSCLFFQNTGGNTLSSFASLATASSGQGNGFLPSPICALANCFAYWRGGFHFRFKIAKTKFHTGRLLFSFIPIAGLGSYTPYPAYPNALGAANPLTMQFMSWVWDLREGNSFDVKVPWQCNTDYLDNGYGMGYLNVYVLDKLTGPDTVATTVPFNVEVCALPGFELAVPCTPYCPPAPASGTLLIAQGGIDEFAIGERVLSIKQLISKACGYAIGGTTNAPAFSVPTWYNWIDVNTTWGWSGTSQRIICTTGLTKKIIPNCHYFARWYAYARGGTNIHVPINGSGIMAATFIPDRLPVFNPIANNAQYICGAGQGLHVRMPFNSQTSRSTIAGPAAQASSNHNTTTLQWGSPTANGTAVYLAAADDAQLGYFLGPLPLAFNCAVSAVPVMLDDGTFNSSIF